MSTQNNVEAEITQGVADSDSDGREQHRHGHLQGRGADAARDAADHRGEHRHHADLRRERAPDFSRAVNGIPPIDTQRAVTTVLVDDGETTVIGGIFISREQKRRRTARRSCTAFRCSAGCSSGDSANDESRELLIFITPRITK